jgi:hypothetical protein
MKQNNKEKLHISPLNHNFIVMSFQTINCIKIPHKLQKYINVNPNHKNIINEIIGLKTYLVPVFKNFIFWYLSFNSHHK